MDLCRYFLRFAFDGTRFHGWQRQPNAITIQQTLEEAMSMMFRSSIRLTGAGRTDTGVHADEFFAHFDIAFNLNNEECRRMVFRLNGHLGDEITFFELFPVKNEAHARFSAKSRTYRYCIARVRNPFRRNYTFYKYGDMDHILMNQGAKLMMAYSDFTSFSKVDTDTMTNICKISHAAWQIEGSELIFTITADRFLRNMVRAIVGTLLELGTGKISMQGLQEIIEGKNRSNAGESVPAKGLTLYKIVYPEEIYRV